jgi:hypothetical protein
MAQRRRDPHTLDSGRVSLAMRARKKGDARYPFVQQLAGRRRAGLLVLLTVALLALLVFLVAVGR